LILGLWGLFNEIGYAPNPLRFLVLILSPGQYVVVSGLEIRPLSPPFLKLFVVEIFKRVVFSKRLTFPAKRLEREEPDLHKRVIADEMSVNAAAIKAGWLTKPNSRVVVEP
jgi:hypothetical protein